MTQLEKQQFYEKTVSLARISHAIAGSIEAPMQLVLTVCILDDHLQPR